VAYLFCKLARRHKAALSVAALIAVVLVVATAISVWQAKLALTAKRETAEKKAEASRSQPPLRR